MKGDLFKGIVQYELQDGHGYKGKLPVFYPDASSIAAVFTASTSVVRRHLPHPGLHLVELVPGRCLVGFTAFEYRASDIGPYNEVSIGFPITFGHRSIPGLDLVTSLARRTFGGYVWQLPVTTERARYGGVQLYGYPKFLADIELRTAGGWVECVLRADGEPILTLRVRQGPARSGRVTRYKTISMKDGVPLATNIYVLPHAMFETFDRSAATLELGTRHAVCEALRAIGLGARPLLSQHIPSSESILFGPRNLIDD